MSENSDDDLVGYLMRRTFHNVALLKYRLLVHVGAPLTPAEQASLLALKEVDPAQNEACEDLVRATRVLSTPAMLHSLVDQIFRIPAEETQLRLCAHLAGLQRKLGTSRELDLAIQRQRELLDRNSLSMANLEKINAELNEELKSAQHTLASRDSRYKALYGNYIREMCLLKEQLYRSQREKGFVAPHVELVTPMSVPMEGGEGSEEVSVDQLLESRRQLRGLEKKMGELRGKLSQAESTVLERDVHSQRVEDQCRTMDAQVKRQQNDIFMLTTETDKLRKELITAQQQVEELERLLAIAHSRSNAAPTSFSESAAQATAEQDEADSMALATVEATRMRRQRLRDVLTALDTACTNRRELLRAAAAQPSTSAPQIVSPSSTAAQRHGVSILLESSLSKIQTESAEIAPEECDGRIEALQLEVETLQQQVDASRRQISAYVDAEHEHTSEIIAVKAAFQQRIDVLAAELANSQKAMARMQLLNEAVTAAYYTVTRRFQVLRSRSGLSSYRQRGNAHNAVQLERAVFAVREEASVHIDESHKEVERIEETMEYLRNKMFIAEEARRLDAESYEINISRMSQRMELIENASATLVQDIQRLQKAQLQDAMTAVQAATVISEKTTSEVGTPLDRLASPCGSSFYFELARNPSNVTALDIFSATVSRGTTDVERATAQLYDVALVHYKRLHETLASVITVENAVDQKNKDGTTHRPQRVAAAWDMARMLLPLEERCRETSMALQRLVGELPFMALPDLPPTSPASTTPVASRLSPIVRHGEGTGKARRLLTPSRRLETDATSEDHHPPSTAKRSSDSDPPPITPQASTRGAGGAPPARGGKAKPVVDVLTSLSPVMLAPIEQIQRPERRRSAGDAARRRLAALGASRAAVIQPIIGNAKETEPTNVTTAAVVGGGEDFGVNDASDDVRGPMKELGDMEYRLRHVTPTPVGSKALIKQRLMMLRARAAQEGR